MPDKHREVVAALEATAATRRHRTALIDGERRVSYQELVAEVGARASQLLEAGVRPGDRIALVAENSADFLSAAFAVLKAGAVLVTIYPSSGRDDLQESLSSADPVLVLVDEGTRDWVGAVIADGVPLVEISGDFELAPVRRSSGPNPTGLREPLYLICYSSGTTSRPKAIMLSQENVYNGVDTYAEVWHLEEADTTVVALPMAWLFGLATSALTTLLRGGTVVVLRRASPELMIEAIARHKVTFLPGVTTMFAKMVHHLEAVEQKPDLSSLRLCISGGEPRNEPVFARWRVLTGCPVHDTFCASECFPLITYDPVADPEPVPGSAGKVVPGSLLRVVDPAGDDVAAGEVGEALANGPGLFLGYWKDEEQTRNALTADGWCRQRDQVRVDEQGYVYVVGRLSDLIIRGGSNVSPAEVEHVLRDHPAVHDVAVVGQPDEVYGQRVTAVLVLEPGSGFDVAELRDFARARLSGFKVPSEYVVLHDLARNASGKVDRRAVAAALRHVSDASTTSGTSPET